MKDIKTMSIQRNKPPAHKAEAFVLVLTVLLQFIVTSNSYAEPELIVQKKYLQITTTSGLATFHTLSRKKLDYGVPRGTTLEVLRTMGNHSLVKFCLDEGQILRGRRNSCRMSRLKTAWVHNSPKYSSETQKPTHLNQLFPSDTSETINKSKEIQKANIDKNSKCGETIASGLSLREGSWSGHQGNYKCSLPYNTDFKITSPNHKGWVEVLITNTANLVKEDSCRKNACIKKDTKSNTCLAYGGFLYVGRSTKKYVAASECLKDGDGQDIDEVSVVDISTSASFCESCEVVGQKNDLRSEVAKLAAQAKKIKEKFISPVGAVLPLRGTVKITDAFHMRKRHPVTGRRTMHWGIDIISDQPEIMSVLPGKVVKVYEQAKPGYRRAGVFPYRGYGNIVVVEAIVDGEKRHIMYSHLERNSVTVKKGDRVKAGQVIAKMGNTGQVNGHHLDLTYCRPGNKGYCDSRKGDFTNPAQLFGEQLLDKINPRRLALWNGAPDNV